MIPTDLFQGCVRDAEATDVQAIFEHLQFSKEKLQGASMGSSMGKHVGQLLAEVLAECGAGDVRLDELGHGGLITRATILWVNKDRYNPPKNMSFPVDGWWISCVDNSTMYSLDAFTTQYHLTTVC